MSRQRTARRLMHSSDPAAAAWRDAQADVDADIEGLARNPATDQFVADMDAAGVPIERQIEQLKAYFLARRNGKPPQP